MKIKNQLGEYDFPLNQILNAVENLIQEKAV